MDMQDGKIFETYLQFGRYKNKNENKSIDDTPQIIEDNETMLECLPDQHWKSKFSTHLDVGIGCICSRLAHHSNPIIFLFV